jgi:hypothetical protein
MILKYLLGCGLLLSACTQPQPPPLQPYISTIAEINRDLELCENYLKNKQFRPNRLNTNRTLTEFMHDKGIAVPINDSRLMNNVNFHNPSTTYPFMLINDSLQKMRGYTTSDFLSPFIVEAEEDSTKQFYRKIPACWVWSVSWHYTAGNSRVDCDQNKATVSQQNNVSIPFQKTFRTQLKSGKPFDVFSHALSPQVSLINEMLRDFQPKNKAEQLKLVTELVEGLHQYYSSCHYENQYMYNIDTNACPIYCAFLNGNKKDSSLNCWNHNPLLCKEPIGATKPNSEKDLFIHPQKAAATLQIFEKSETASAGFKYNQKFVQLSPAQVRTMRLPALCPPRDSLIAIADYIDQTQPTFILFKKHFRVCEAAYNFFLLYYFDFPEGKAPILRDIRVVVPDNFGLNIYPN